MNRNQAITSCDPFQLIQALMHGGKAVEMQLDDALAPVGISAVQWSALKALVQAEGQLPLGQLAERLACVKSNATRLIDRLEAEQLVRRVPDPEDRRSIHAELTAKGQEVYEAGLQVVRDFEQRLLAGYTQEEHLLLNRLLTQLSAIPVG
jgi:DNA-binding MarR family transcriptional regulator